MAAPCPAAPSIPPPRWMLELLEIAWQQALPLLLETIPPTPPEDTAPSARLGAQRA